MRRSRRAASGTTFTDDGPVKWLSPEAIEGVYSTASDVWAYGIAVWELATGEKPFAELSGAQAALAIARGQLVPRPSPAKVTDQLWQTLNACWQQSAAARPSIADVVSQLAVQLTDDVRQHER